jgi:hypothetical protein
MAIAYERSAQDGWILLERYLNEPEVQSARMLLKTWREENPRMDRTTLLEFPSFAKLIASQKASSTDQGSSSLLSLIGLDPLSGLAPAARQVELARQFGERALFFVQRAPEQLSDEIDLKALQLRESPEAKQVLLDEQRITQSIETITRTAASLPDTVRVEREAAVNQISQVMTTQREGLMHDLEGAQPGMTTLMSETRQTLEAATQFSAQATQTVRALDQFVASVSPSKPAPPPPTSEPPSKPFEISEVGTSAEQIGVAARDVATLLAGVDQSLPQVKRLMDTAATRSEQTVDYALRHLLITGCILIGAIAFAVLMVRWASARLRPPQSL